jgi:hypothetical protein
MIRAGFAPDLGHLEQLHVGLGAEEGPQPREPVASGRDQDGLVPLQALAHEAAGLVEELGQIAVEERLVRERVDHRRARHRPTVRLRRRRRHGQNT